MRNASREKSLDEWSGTCRNNVEGAISSGDLVVSVSERP